MAKGALEGWGCLNISQPVVGFPCKPIANLGQLRYPLKNQVDQKDIGSYEYLSVGLRSGRGHKLDYIAYYSVLTATSLEWWWVRDSKGTYPKMILSQVTQVAVYSVLPRGLCIGFSTRFPSGQASTVELDVMSYTAGPAGVGQTNMPSLWAKKGA